VRKHKVNYQNGKCTSSGVHFKFIGVNIMIPKKRAKDAYKNQFGRVVVIAGSFNMSGAAELATAAVLRSGAGLTVLASTRDVINRVGGFIPEAMFTPLEAAEDGFFSGGDADKIPEILNGADAVLFGNGVGTGTGAEKILRAVIDTDVPIKIIDADGINLIARDIQLLKEAKGTTVLTPHQGELERLIGEKFTNRSEVASRIYNNYGAVVVAKGVPTYICEKSVTAVNAGNPGLAKGGSGDVLAGIIAAFSAATAAENIPEALKTAVMVHGKAADLAATKFGETSMLSGDVVSAIPEAIMRICYHE
jgi:NAD(P)H-hydrate epimerase